jgi:arabinose-5-phosphate isomerase
MKSTDRINKAHSIIHQFGEAINSIVVTENFSKAIDIMLSCKGKIITTGIGKAGLAIQKFSSTLCSLGFPSYFLHPTEAQHGDLGTLKEDDVLFVCSTSGKTREVYEIIDLARNLKISRIVGITSHPDSPIRNKVDLVIDMGIHQEAGHLGIAPTTSILVILAITDTLALIAAEEKGFTREDYSVRHHAGYCGAAARQDNKIY